MDTIDQRTGCVTQGKKSASAPITLGAHDPEIAKIVECQLPFVMVEVSGGCVTQIATSLPEAKIILVDYDNIKEENDGIAASCAAEEDVNALMRISKTIW